MYIPKFNQVTDRATLLEAMRAYSFAILFSTPLPDRSGVPIATHLPLVIKDEGEHGVIEGHFARANRHWQLLDGREVLIVFPGPHSYVSPTLYSDPLSVPTWNYVAIHACGTGQIIDDECEKDALLKGLIAQHEPAYADQWRSLPEGYRRTLLSSIVGFRVSITRIEGKFKISQNRPEADRRNVYAAQAAGTADQQALASWMSRLIP